MDKLREELEGLGKELDLLLYKESGNHWQGKQGKVVGEILSLIQPLLDKQAEEILELEKLNATVIVEGHRVLDYVVGWQALKSKYLKEEK